MKVISLLISLFFLTSSFVQALELEDYVGKFSSPYNNGTFVMQLEVSEFGLDMKLTSGWNKKIQGKTYEFECEENKCISSFSEISLGIELTLLRSGNILWKDTGTSSPSQLFKPYHSSSKKRWEIIESTDSEGLQVYTANVLDKENNASLVVSCTAGSTDIKMSLKIEKTIWRAIAYTIGNQHEALKVILNAKGVKKHSIDQWELDSNDNALLRLDAVTENELSDLRAGNFAKMKLVTVSTNGQETSFAKLVFSLRGSTKALNSMKEKCSASE